MEILDYQPKEVIVKIGGNEYHVAPRTEAVEKAIREHDADIGVKSQFESDYSLVEILLGKSAAKELFPLGENENLDRLYFIASKLIEAYRANYRELADEMSKSQLNPAIEQLKELAESVKPLLALTRGIPSKPQRKK